MIILKNTLKKIILIIIDKFGYRLINKKLLDPVDQRKLTNNPKAIHYYTNSDRQVLIEAELKNGRGLEIFSLEKNSLHPFIYATREAINSNEPKKVLRKSLKKYYLSVVPYNASEWLGLKKNEVPLLDKEPPWVSLLPWENTSIFDKKLGRQKCAIYDNKEHGGAYSIKKGWRNFGPVSEEVLEVETNRLFKLMQSVEKYGFIRDYSNKGDIGGIVLINESNEWKWLVEWGGQHRVAVLSAMGYEKISIRVWQVVERKDVEIWPCVQSGIYSKDSALRVFDNIFYADPNNFIYRNWNNI
ncbi:hypothetical protein AB9G26_05995 [Francisella philomiragia]|uniref:hypothetical protein n=1 Tax=Francisella philomiragia TaxID=28110 RepID=UPI003516738F